jgi:cell division protein FtsB
MPVPSMYEQPKKQILATHYEAQARTEERLVQTYVSQSIDMTSPVATSTQTEAVNEKNASPSDEGEEQLGTITSDVKEHPSLLHFLFGFLPGASTPQTWRPAGTAVVLALILFMGWHVINGKDGLSVWQQKRAEDKRLQIEIDQLQQENARLHDHISSLNTDKDAIEREAREKLHYARSGEIIYAIPEQAAQSSPAR